ncbi:phosphonate ABC transporter ATP-binding protein [Roseomonas marmotae]|uniref:Phosphonate ABC transporter ATP-binding protein n=1 Tax=Roseomonas marmotae TaxID=2768161 RepID=A0ABS3K6K6_9PROT|nr:phosphonate ABC transporter ATP-binding protein [Roseomonas marmotae]MBO1073078.1 phosphonate ABC transporter ATP-binding protein [Roseomonas marmotae]QTI79280.1 phosphonate ABC transporter ATP-binding protein [Roseomonas marmotae]
MLQLEGLTRRFGATTAVDRVSLSVPAGQMVGIIGRSGAGKSTLLRMVNRLTEPSEGRVLHDGMDVTALRGQALRDWRTASAMIFQQFNLVQRLDVLTNVLVGRLNHRRGFTGTLATLFKRFTAEERAMALSALARFDLADQALQRADTLSGGQQQRVAIARALLQQPKLILADEPIASLDPRNARVVMEALRDVNRRDGITVLCNLHHLETARHYCDRIVAMQQGRVMFDGAPAALTAARIREIYGVSEDEFDTAPEMAARAAQPSAAPMPA